MPWVSFISLNSLLISSGAFWELHSTLDETQAGTKAAVEENLTREIDCIIYSLLVYK